MGIFGLFFFSFSSEKNVTSWEKDPCHFNLLDCEIAGMGTVATGAYRVS